jgi:glycosyltransferase involved in cell wall biosynthesis
MTPKITIHTIIKNEDRWIWYALKSVIDLAQKILIYDTGSTDKTLEVIETINSPKIILESHPASTRQDLVKLRQHQLDRTTTPWFMLLDGDEIWPRPNLLQLLTAATKNKPETLAFFTRTRNCVGDIYHYLPKSAGRYQIKGVTGHLNIRLIRKVPGLKIVGEYPLEAYTLEDTPIQNLESRIQFVDTWYLHATHLPHSTSILSTAHVIDRLGKLKFWRPGLKMSQTELPEVFWAKRPDIVPSSMRRLWFF